MTSTMDRIRMTCNMINMAIVDSPRYGKYIYNVQQDEYGTFTLECRRNSDYALLTSENMDIVEIDKFFGKLSRFILVEMTNPE